MTIEAWQADVQENYIRFERQRLAQAGSAVTRGMDLVT